MEDSKKEIIGGLLVIGALAVVLSLLLLPSFLPFTHRHEPWCDFKDIKVSHVELPSNSTPRFVSNLELQFTCSNLKHRKHEDLLDVKFDAMDVTLSYRGVELAVQQFPFHTFMLPKSRSVSVTRRLLVNETSLSVDKLELFKADVASGKVPLSAAIRASAQWIDQKHSSDGLNYLQADLTCDLGMLLSQKGETNAQDIVFDGQQLCPVYLYCPYSR